MLLCLLAQLSLRNALTPRLTLTAPSVSPFEYTLTPNDVPLMFQAAALIGYLLAAEAGQLAVDAGASLTSLFYASLVTVVRLKLANWMPTEPSGLFSAQCPAQQLVTSERQLTRSHCVDPRPLRPPCFPERRGSALPPPPCGLIRGQIQGGRWGCRGGGGVAGGSRSSSEALLPDGRLEGALPLVDPG